MAVNKNKILRNAAKYTKKGQYMKAVNEYRKLTQEEYGDNSINNTIGDLLIRAKNYSEAILEYEKAGDYYERRGFIPRALAIYKKILRQDPDRASIYQKLAHLYADQGLIQDAISQYEILAKHFEHSGDIEAALDSYRQIADLDPANISIRERLATLYSQKGFKEKAADERVKIGDAFIKRGEYIAAVKSYENAMAEIPDHQAAVEGIVNAYLAEGRTGEARQLLDQILEKSPDNTDALKKIGQIYIDNDRIDDAIKVFSQVYQIDPSQDGVCEMLGKLYIAKGKFPDAFRFLKEIINLAIERNNLNRALDILNKLQELDPENIVVRERKIEIYQKLNEHDNVKKMFEEMAEIYYNQSRLEESFNIYERLFLMDPQDQRIKQRLNQISIEFKGRPIDTGRLVETPSFAGMKDVKPEKEKSKSESRDLDTPESGILDLDADDVSLENLFDTSELAKHDLPIFPEQPVIEGQKSSEKDDLSVEVFSLEEEADVEEKPKPERPVSTSEDQLREFRIEAGVYIKYGLLEKAAERLEAILVTVPDDDESLERLTEVYERLGKLDAMVDVIDKRVATLVENDMLEHALMIVKNALSIAPGNNKLVERMKKLEGAAVSNETPLSGDMAPLYTMDGDEEISPLIVGLDTKPPDSMDIPLGSTVGRGDSSAMATENGGLSSGLAEVVREFREDLISRDQEKEPETHYNLGIAYMEMGLTEEAIAELQVTMDYPDYLIRTAGILSHCYVQIGAFDKALAVLTRAIKSSEAGPQELISLKYDLAQTMKRAGHQTSAITVLKEIQEETPGYRDVDEILSEYS
jgi:tetratricopeptide (TPR) repeat protein